MSVVHFRGLHLLRVRNLEVLREYKVGGNSGEVQESPRNLLAPLIGIPVKGDLYQCLSVVKYLGFLLDGQSLLSKNHS